MTITKVFDVHYPAGHHYSETWEWQDGLHCPKCQAHYIFRRTGGDYYQGQAYMCGECGCNWSCQGFSDPIGGEDAQRFAKLRN